MQFQLFFDYQSIVDSCPFFQKYDALFRAFDMVYTKSDFSALGRRGYPKSAYLKALIYKQCEQIKYVSDLIRDLESRPAICLLIGFEPGRLPSASCFSRFLSSMNNSEVEQLTHSAAKLLIEAGHVSTNVLIGDSKPIRANTVENNPNSATTRTSSSLRTAKSASSPTSGAIAPMFSSAGKASFWSRSPSLTTSPTKRSSSPSCAKSNEPTARRKAAR